MKLTKNDLKLTNAVADEKERRPVLSNVLLRKGRLIAADGFMLVGRQADLNREERLAKEESVLLPARILRLIKPQRKETIELELGEDNTVKVTIKEGGRVKDPTLSFSLPQDIGSFPIFDNAIPVSDKLAHTAIDLKKLRKFLASLPDEGILRLGIGEPSDIIEGYVWGIGDGQPTRAFIMPMYVPWEDHKWAKDDPAWLLKPKPDEPKPEEG